MLLTVDGVPKVVDFGLARLRTADPSLSSPHLATEDLALTLTTLSQFRGTPAYMSAEQRQGQPADASSDQYSFCVALYEALVGELPPPASTELATLSPSSSLPTWIRNILRRGLQPDPEARWPSMLRLLEELERPPRRRRRRWAAAAASLGIVGTIGGWGLHKSPMAVQQRRCEADTDAREALWSDRIRVEIKRAVLATDLPFAPETWVRLDGTITRFVDAWDASHHTLCSPNLAPTADLTARVTCLEQQLDPLRAVVTRLRAAEPSTVQRASTFSILPPEGPQACVQGSMVPSAADLDAGAGVGDKLTQDLLDVRLDAGFGQFDRGLEMARTVVAQARTAGQPKLEAEALPWQARLEEEFGQYAQAEATFKAARDRASRAKADETAVEAAVALVRVIGTRNARYGEALVRAEHAQVLLLRHGARPDTRAALEAHIAQVLTETADYAGAQAALERAITILEQKVGEDAHALPDVLVAHAWSFIHRQQFVAARKSLDRALRAVETGLGPQHPKVAVILADQGELSVLTGHYEKASEQLDHALSLGARVLGPNHPKLANAHLQRGWVAYRQGRLDEAESHFQTALAIRKNILPPEHPDLGRVFGRLGVVARARGEPAQAQRLHLKNLRIASAAFGEDNPRLVPTLLNLAEALTDLDDHGAAISRLDRAVALIERHHGPRHRSLGEVLASLAIAHERAGNHPRAKAVRRREIEVWRARLEATAAKHGVDHVSLVQPSIKLATRLRGIGEMEEALAISQRAGQISGAHAETSPEGHVEALVGLAQCHLEAGHAQEALRFMDEGLAFARRHLPTGATHFDSLEFGRLQALWGLGPADSKEAIHIARTMLARPTPSHGAEAIKEWLDARGVAVEPVRDAGR